MDIVFFEKPGCVGNARQKALLSVAGHSLQVVNLLTHPFTPNELRSYFGAMRVTEWFNRSAPRVKSGEVQPDLCDERTAIELMLEDRLLIRRPLLKINGMRCAGFDVGWIEQLLGPLDQNERLAALREQDLEQCPGAGTGYRCPDANATSAAEGSEDRSSARANAQPDRR